LGRGQFPAKPENTLNLSFCAYSDRKTGAHFCGIRAEKSRFHGVPAGVRHHQNGAFPADIIDGGSFRPPITRICLKATPIRCLANIFA
jgi:hypothetical protein